MKSEKSSVLRIISEENKLFRLDNKDALIMLSMTLIYLVIALFNLGSLKVPATSWKPSKAGESVTFDLGGEYDVSRVYYYGGIGDGKYRIEYMDGSGKFTSLVTLDKKDIYSWKYTGVSAHTRRIRVTFDTPDATLYEIGFFDKNSTSPIKEIRIIEKNIVAGSAENLVDEQNKIPYSSSFMTGMYFDEIYHARTAFEHINKIEPFEWTHPPLGKLFIASGILIFGMNPFGWRIAGTLVGAAMIPIMYAFGRKLFNKKFYGFCSAFLMMFDFMHFTQTRIATIDVYGTFFIILMYYYMYDYFTRKSYDLDFMPSLRPLFLSGLFFGIGVACKWIALYGGAGLALLFFLTKYQEYRDYTALKNSPKNIRPTWTGKFIPLYLIATMLYCILFFVIIPGTIYLLSYIPFMKVPGSGHGIKDVLRYQSLMLDYHGKLVATHPFSSPWYQWPFIYKPTWFFGGTDTAPGMASTIVTMGNPAIWWTGIAAVIASIYISIIKKDRKMAVVFTAIAFQYIPWMLVPRITWIYHFFSTLPFVILSIVYVIQHILEKSPQMKLFIYAYLCLTAVMFIWFYPALSGFEVSKSYIESLKWFKSWVF